jgi:CheY-like chemotaxis protein
MSPLGRCKFLVVEDNKVTARAVKRALAEYGEVILAHTTVDALAELSKHPDTDIILIDGLLPAVDPDFGQPTLETTIGFVKTIVHDKYRAIRVAFSALHNAALIDAGCQYSCLFKSKGQIGDLIRLVTHLLQARCKLPKKTIGAPAILLC